MAPRTVRKKKQQQSSVFFDGEMRCIEPKILEISLERKLQGKRFPKFRYISRGCTLFWKVWKILFHSLLEKMDVFVEWKALPAPLGLRLTRQFKTNR